MQYEKSCRNCQRYGTDSCYEIRPDAPCYRFLPALSVADREAWRNAREAADERRYPKDRNND